MAGVTDGTAIGPVLSLAEFLRARKAAILADWEHRVRALSVTRDLNRSALLDHLPALLDRIAGIAESIAAGQEPEPPVADADEHAHQRLDEGFELSAVVREYALLRQAVLDRWEVEHGPAAGTALRALNEAIDYAVAASVDRYTEARNRTLVALDRVSSAALESESLDGLLGRLLQVFVETTTAVDTSIILLREGDRLHVRASVGLEDEHRARFSLRIGEGFAGQIAAERRALFSRCACEDPRVVSPYIRAKRVRALYGVPLIDGGGVIGVAHMGSLTAYEFSDQDKRLFRTMAARATSAIQLHQQRDAAEARARALRRLDQLISVHPDLFYVFDPDGHRLAYASPSLLSLLDVTAEQALGRTLEELGFPPATVAEIERLTRQVVSNRQVARGEGEFATTGGKSSYYEYVLAPVIAGDGPVEGVAGVSRDITARKLVELEQGRAAEFRERFIGILAHDLRNPLNTIKMSAQVLLQHEDRAPGDVRALLRVVHASERMERLIRDMVDFARARLGGGFPIAAAPTNLADVCRTVAQELEVSNPGREIRVEPTGGCEGNWDPDRLAQMVSNLAANALQHGDAATPVTLRTGARDEAHVFLEVHNCGSPIPGDMLPHVFEPFRRGAEGEGSRTSSSVGLGLYIVKEIATAHGGSVAVTSSKDEGTTFRVVLPRTPPVG